MYRLNKLMRPVLITTDEVIFHGPTKQTLDPRTIAQAIIIAEERFIRPALGSAFYDSLAAAKNTTVTLLNQVALQANVLATGSSYTLAIGDVVNAWELLSEANQTLWKTILWKLTAECVIFSAIPDAFVQFASEGVVHTSPPAGPMTQSGVVTPQLNAVKWTMDKKLQDRIDPMVEALKYYLCANRGNYGAFDSTGNCPSDCSEEINSGMSRKTAWVTSIYDERDDGCCR